MPDAAAMTDYADPRYFVTVQRPESERRIPLVVPRTRAEIVQLEERGFRVDTLHEEGRKDRSLQSLFGQALLAVSKLHRQAIESGNADLTARAENAVKELLAGSGVSLDEARSAAPSPNRLEVPLQPEHETWPGLGGGGLQR